ncbi:hypothetical protein GCM10022419_003600 [Nonomuraea rosea]|uniref:Uncharacterized protein n=1 Tax=Nonomuraea rosea TaxID=638574 RepID=A0ABP6V628_9ACTN
MCDFTRIAHPPPRTNGGADEADGTDGTDGESAQDTRTRRTRCRADGVRGTTGFDDGAQE